MNRRSKLLRIILVIKLLIDLIITYKKLKQSVVRRWWILPHLQPHLRDIYGAHNHLFTYFRVTNHEQFYKFCNMNVENFLQLYDLVHEHLVKKSRRQPIPPNVRLTVVLYWLSHGGSLHNISWLFRIGLSTVYALIIEVCGVLSKVLIPKYVEFPSKERWLQIAEDFYNQWNFPNCIGALDGTHIPIEKPSHTGGLYKNYKKFYSLVLLAPCDAKRRFIWFNFGDYGSKSDSSIFSVTDLSQMINNNTANIPPPRKLPHTDIATPFVIVADEIFGLQKHIMKPYNRRNNLSVEEKVFNYRLSRARLNIECTFGIMYEKWTILHSPLAFGVKNVDKIICAIIGLHNFLLYENDNNSEYAIEKNYNYRQADENKSPIIVRENLKNYFSSPQGSVHWQYDRI